MSTAGTFVFFDSIHLFFVWCDGINIGKEYVVEMQKTQIFEYFSRIFSLIHD